jgi:hypothetical protein
MGTLWLVGAVGFATFAVCLRFALQMLVDHKYRDSAVWFFWSFLPVLVVCLVLVGRGDPVMSDMTRNIILGLVGAALGSSVAIWAGYVIVATVASAQITGATVPDAKSDHPQITISGGDNVVSVGQIGGITARVVTINPPMKPELRIIGRTETDNQDGSHTVTIKTEVASPITPGLLIVQIRARGIRRVMIVPPSISGFSSIQLRNVSGSDSFYSAEIPSPNGQYDISVQTSAPTEIQLNATF